MVRNEYFILPSDLASSGPGDFSLSGPDFESLVFFSFLAFLTGDGPAAEAESFVEFVFEDFVDFVEFEVLTNNELVVSGGPVPASR